MKKIYLLLIFTFYACFSFAQSFTSPGNQWHYNNCSCFFFPYPNTAVPLETGTTTLIGGKLCTEIVGGVFGSTVAYVYESNDSVYYYVNALNGFSLLYDFNASVGDTLKIYGDISTTLDSISIQIDSINIISINGFSKKQFYWSELQNTVSFHLSFGYGPTTSYIEDIGGLFYLIPLNGLIDGIGGLRCFQDSTIGLYQAAWAPTCNSVFYLGVDNLEIENEIQIQPNPFENKISLQGSFSQKGTIRIFNMLAETVYFSKTEKREIELSFLTKGIYYLSIEEGKSRAIKKIVKL